MVHQMWLWVIDERTIISAGTERMATDNKSFFKFLERSLQKFTENLYTGNGETPLQRSKHRPGNLLIQELVSRCTHFLDRPNLAGFEDPIFSSFDNVVGRVSEKVTGKYSEFRESLEAPEHQIRDTSNITISVESELLLDIRDVRDELSMVRNVFCQQRDVLEDMSTELEDSRADIHNGSSCIPRVSKFLRRLQLIDENAENVERAIQQLLDLKSQRANLNEACSTADQTRAITKQAASLAKQADQSAQQGKVILAFTVVTVFFTPLSWMSAIFAVNLEDGQAYRAWQVVTGEVASLVLTGLVIWLALLLFNREPEASEEQNDGTARYLGQITTSSSAYLMQKPINCAFQPAPF
jgi:hypothetical protein